MSDRLTERDVALDAIFQKYRHVFDRGYNDADCRERFKAIVSEVTAALTQKLAELEELQLLDVHAIADQRDKAVQRADELAVKLAELEREGAGLRGSLSCLLSELCNMGANETTHQRTAKRILSTPTNSGHTCPNCGVSNFIPKAGAGLCPGCERNAYEASNL